ncbi:Outer membrane porin F precursor [Marinovum algicola]|uniref:Outer membrane protein OmpA n=1 Tax=Marinovum algicola TaxID=42444 RepID=A0A975W916_9RHOB|nr:OmpA family protein [Marinovum algicola]SEJ24404.1 Outer membrane protein OmpA [Marinovum algicola]SLN47802.1 Outer membrane porin F precursor [Marinovum algicola]
MTRSTLMKSTAIVLSLALAVPTVAPAQSGDVSAFAAGEMPSAEQIDEMGRDILEQLGVLIGLDRDAARAMELEELRVAIKTELGLPVDEAAESEEPPAETAEVTAEGAAEVTAEAAEETAAEVEGAAEAAVEEAQDVVEEAADAAETASEEAGEQTEELREALEDAQAEEAPEVEQQIETEAEAEAEAQVETETQVESEAEAEAEAETEAQAETETQAETSLGGLAGINDIDAMSRDQLLALASDLSLDLGATENMSEAELRTAVKAALGMEVEVVEPAPEETEPDTTVADSTPMAAEDDAATAEGEVVVETVTEADVRSSSEEFGSDVIVEQQAEQRGTREDDDDDDDRGFSNAETAAALGLGVLALSQILGDADEVVSNSGDRVVVRRGNDLQVIRDDDVLLRQPGSEVETRNFADGSSRVVVTRPDGSQVITVRAADGTVVRRVQVRADGRRIVLFDDTEEAAEPVDVTTLPEPRRQQPVTVTSGDRAALEAALNAQLAADVDRRFSLNQVRSIREVRHLMPEVTLDAVNFQTGSAVIQPGEAEELADLGSQLADFLAANPDELFIVEGHTDTVGDAAYNLALSDRRAESVALALVEYFDVPPENLIIQGYGESDLLVPREGPERANRRATVRRITPLLHRNARLD